MATPFLGEIKMVTFNFAPKGYALCNGQTLSIQQNTALFSLLGTTYGGNGTSTFQLPNLQGRAPMHFNGQFLLGQVGGENTHALLISEMPAHAHAVQVVSRPGTQQTPGGNFLAAHRGGYADSADANTSLIASTLAQAGGSQPHDNMPPYLVINFVIALSGIFPSRP
jgi:microcystin-dependent protein